MKTRIFVALDVDTAEQAMEIVNDLHGLPVGFKVGKQLFTATGPDLVKDIVASGAELFLDLKYHDIPNTVAKAGVEAAKLGATLFNVHATGGLTMMETTVKTLQKLEKRPLAIAVTVLTSMSEEDLQQIGITISPEQQVRRLAKLAQKAGMDGVVASAKEIKAIREECGNDFIIVTPGIRPATSGVDDQKRVATPAQAISDGATALVIGRPITQAANRRQACEDILAEI